MKVLFMGSGTFGLPVLDAVFASRHTLAAVVTAPDKPTGRGRVLTPSPIKVWAESHRVPVLTPQKINTPESIAALREAAADVHVVASYGALLSREVLALPPSGPINVHPSLLPKYRGASPVVQALLNGDTRTGMTIMAMAPELDAGDILLQESVDVGPDEDARSLTDRLTAMGGRMTVEAIDRIASGRVTRTPQVHADATYCTKLKKEDAKIDWTRDARTIHNRVRALTIWPGTVARWRDKGLRVLETRLGESGPESAGRAPGEVLAIDPTKGIGVQTGGGALWLRRVQPEGGRPMDFRDFVNGSSIKPGSALG